MKELFLKEYEELINEKNYEIKQMNEQLSTNNYDIKDLTMELKGRLDFQQINISIDLKSEVKDQKLIHAQEIKLKGI